MNLLLLKAGFLGIVEGVTEFLPISSTGHLIVAGNLVHFTGETAKVFEIFIQLGSILAVTWLFRWKIIEAFTTKFRLAVKVFAAFLPAAVIGLLTHKYITQYLFVPLVVAISLIVGGITILIIEATVKKFTVENVDKVTMQQSLAIGFAQVLSLIPGVSRSGATIMGGMVAKLDRKAATEFSFLLAIPTMFAATLYDLYKNASMLSSGDVPMFAVGFVTAFISALIVVKLFLKFIGTHTFKGFAWYRIVFGLVVILALRWNV